MEEFIEVAIRDKYFNRRTLEFGVGINDAWYVVRSNHGVVKECPYYKRWRSMLRRCYSSATQSKQPTYVGCYVHKSWLMFSTFRLWMEKQDWVGKALDKDLLLYGNKEYGPVSCMFVSQSLNSILCDSGATRGLYPMGVDLHKATGKFRWRCRSSNWGHTKSGLCDTVHKAERAYCIAKATVITKAAYSEEALADSRLTPALLRHAAKFTERAEELTKLINKTT